MRMWLSEISSTFPTRSSITSKGPPPLWNKKVSSVGGWNLPLEGRASKVASRKGISTAGGRESSQFQGSPEPPGNAPSLSFWVKSNSDAREKYFHILQLATIYHP